MESKEEQKSFNRIIIVGNGFDLAYGLKTRYYDFILDYFKRNAIEAFKRGTHKTELLKIQIECFVPASADDWEVHINKIGNIKDVISLLKKEGTIDHSDNTFFNYLINLSFINRWVDIEALYYEFLLRNHNGGNVEEVKKLNSYMESIRQALSIYIKEEQSRQLVYYKNLIFEDFFSCLFEPLNWSFAELVKNHRRKNPPENVMFLNFNYTNTVETMIEAYPNFKNRSRHISIHGTVNDIHNPIIFGYGDDTDENYSKLEMKGDNEWLTKIKSFHYPRTNNYHKLLNFLSSEDFDVFIVGHSCGLSDRTLLKTIFEHENCLAIRNYHYNGESEDFNKRMEISRHFNDKIKMRERLLPFDLNAQIPQAKRK